MTGAGSPPRRAGAIAALLVVLVALAVAKPWQEAPATKRSAIAPYPTAALPTPLSVAPAISPSPASSPDLLPLPPAVEIGMLIEYRDAWGVRLIVGRTQLAERWAAAPVPMPDGVADLDEALVTFVLVPASERPIRLLGLTTPAGVDVGEIELAVARPVAGTDRLELHPLEAVAWRGRTLLFAPPDRDEWAPGIYQFRVEAGGSRTSISVAIITGSTRS